ncbi:hypothetical protein [Tabrizicola sp.]|jgi:hypothetical protein|uniref:hypothetical protein n=1 Tax=Tabrizicola sp. TaxID=2005166 RepID=UPI0025D6548A|nr:hypothetical protein [Tabrizicola sp.]MBY0349492.1 hypothetical protein [Tabrizicola sp.]MDK2774774.1 hypothetical protein [Tabrizicola sp.]
MQSLQDRLADILRDLDLAMREVEKIKAQEELIRDMIREARGEPKVKLRAPRSNVKQTILNLLDQAGAVGLNAATAVETSAKAGVTLERGTVSSLLSRLKNEGVVSYDGSVYRLTKYKGDALPNVHPLRTSGVFS